MKWKESLLGLLGISAPAIATKAQDTQPDSLNHKTEITQRPRFRNIEEPIPQNNNNLPPDTIDFQLLSETILPDSIYADTLNLDTLSTDSIAHTWNLMTPREKLQSCANQMLCFISQFEDIKAQSYYDNVGHKWTVGPGWTYINGKPVTSTTKIRNAEEMFTLWSNDLNKENGYFDRIEETLHLDKMLARTEEDVRKQQGTLCCFESLMWNCGPGVMGTKDKPSQLVASYNDFLETGDSIYLHKAITLYMQHNKVSHTVKRGNKNVKIRVENPTLTKRRKAECQILNGNTILAMGKPETEEDKQNNIWYVEISSLGDIYSVTPSKDAQFPKDWVEKLNNPTYGKNFGDTINTQFRSRAETEVSNRRFTAPRSTRNRSTRAQATRRTSTR